MIAFWDTAPRSLVEADEHSRDAHLGLLQQDLHGDIFQKAIIFIFALAVAVLYSKPFI
jgi:hypothetical protein